MAADETPKAKPAMTADPTGPLAGMKTEYAPAIKAANKLITQIRSQIELKDRAGMTQCGERAHKRVTEFSDRILSQTRHIAGRGGERRHDPCVSRRSQA